MSYQHLSYPIWFLLKNDVLTLLWCVCGGFLQHFYECSFLDILLKRNYEKPVDTAQDILDRRLAVLYIPGTESRVAMSKNSDSNISPIWDQN